MLYSVSSGLASLILYSTQTITVRCQCQSFFSLLFYLLHHYDNHYSKCYFYSTHFGPYSFSALHPFPYIFFHSISSPMKVNNCNYSQSMEYDWISLLPVLLVLLICDIPPKVSGTECKDRDGNVCTCCNMSCCPERRLLSRTSFNMWYFWVFMVMFLATCCGVCNYYKRKRNRVPQSIPCSVPEQTVDNSTPAQMPLQYGGLASMMRAAGTHQSPFAYIGPATISTTSLPPPSYTEVVSKPELYPINKGDSASLPTSPITPEESVIRSYSSHRANNNTYVTLNVVNLVRSGSSRGRQGDQGVAPPSYYEAIQSPSSPCSPSSQQELLSSTDK